MSVKVINMSNKLILVINLFFYCIIMCIILYNKNVSMILGTFSAILLDTSC